MNQTTNQNRLAAHGIPNARFWTFENDSWVKLTLRPDQSLQWGKCSRDCEGYSSEGNTWSHEGDRVLLQWSRDGRDCDGRVSSDGELACPLGELASLRPVDGDGPARPHWKTAARTRCRDYSAELANY